MIRVAGPEEPGPSTQRRSEKACAMVPRSTYSSSLPIGTPRARRVTRTEADGSITVLADRWKGKRLNSPNDVVVKSDGSVWFTDPPYGILTDYEGNKGSSEIGRCNVYRIDPKSGAVDVVIDDMVRPNGIAFDQIGRAHV